MIRKQQMRKKQDLYNKGRKCTECSYKIRNYNKSGLCGTCSRKAYRKEPRIVRCGWCEETFNTYPSRKNKKFCCVACCNQAQVGRKRPLEFSINQSIARSGPNSHFWKGGVTPKHRRIRSSAEYARWRTDVFERDNYTCQFCGIRTGEGVGKVVLNADYIKPFSKHPELRLDVDNGRTLCVQCHKTTDTYGVKCK